MHVLVPVAVAALVLAFMLSAASRGDASGVSGPRIEKLSESLYVLRDACNVYVVRRGNRALLIDSGEGAVLGRLAELGVEQVDWVLHTHAHRDQCGATPALRARGAKVAAPEGDAKSFAEVEDYWDRFAIYLRYQFKPDTYKPRVNIPVDRALADNDTLTWEGITFRCISTPGHTEGAGTFLAEIDGKQVAFCGDLIHSAGKVWNLYSFDHKYWDGGLIGITKDLQGLDRVLATGVARLLPSHGGPIDGPAPAVELLRANLSRLYNLQPPPAPKPTPAAVTDRSAATKPAATAPAPAPPPAADSAPPRRWQKVSEHLYHVKYTSFVLVSADGSAMFYDYYALPNRNAMEAYDAIVPLLRDLGVRTVDLVLVSHFHEDHVRGIPDLVRRYGAQVWAYENMVDILEHPDRYNLPCLAPEHIKVDRVLHDNETIRWKEYEFTICHFPGQTMYHQGMYGTVDGKKVFFVGDTDLHPTGESNLIDRDQKLHGISTYLNHYLLEPGQGYLKAVQRVIDYNPELLLFAHSGARAGNPAMYEATLEALSARRALVAAVLPQEDPNIGFDPNRVHFYPYTLELAAGEAFETSVVVRNYLPRPITARVSLATPDGWQVEPAEVSVPVEGRDEQRATFHVMPIGAPSARRRTVVTAHVQSGDENWGEPAEMILEWKG